MKALKNLGQHFLNSPTVLAEIIRASDLVAGENILEIGPGTGILTRALLDQNVIVTAIEKDPRSIALLREKFASEIQEGKLCLMEKDILEVDDDILPKGEYKIVANIPYYITGMILEKFLEYGPRPNKMVLLVQKEVADRILVRDGKNSVLSVSVAAFGSPKYVKTVPPGAFVPAPSVDSAVLAIENINFGKFEENHVNPSDFFGIVKAGFAHKRKFVKSNLTSVISSEKLSKIWQKLALDEKIRAEKMPVSTWFDIVRLSQDLE